VTIVAAAPLTGEQRDLLSASWRDIGAADAALERLRTELGTDAIVRAHAQDTHRPEKAGVWRELSAEEPSISRSVDRSRATTSLSRLMTDRPTDRKTRSSGPMQLVVADAPAPVATMARRALDPPEPVEVLCEGETPRVVTWRGHRIAVTRALGPERLSGDWWDDGYRRDYWRCESLAGDFTVFLDRAEDNWALQGWGD
jgi:nucleotidyltransferase/DNA polymerase involved in DNA repair